MCAIPKFLLRIPYKVSGWALHTDHSFSGNGRLNANALRFHHEGKIV